MLHEGNETQGKSGKQGRTIVRRAIAVAMGQGGSFETGRQIIDVRRPWRTPLRGCFASPIRIPRIAPDFVQVQTGFAQVLEILLKRFYISTITQEFVSPSCNLQARLNRAATSLAAALLLGACATSPETEMPADAVACVDPRPQICTMDYTPVCATRDIGVRCVTTPCQSTETATYANACGACADARVYYYQAGACPL